MTTEQTAGTDPIHHDIPRGAHGLPLPHLHCYRTDVHEGHDYESQDHGKFWCPGQTDEDQLDRSMMVPQRFTSPAAVQFAEALAAERCARGEHETDAETGDEVCRWCKAVIEP